MIGFATRPGTEVEPDVLKPHSRRAPSAADADGLPVEQHRPVRVRLHQPDRAVVRDQGHQAHLLHVLVTDRIDLIHGPSHLDQGFSSPPKKSNSEDPG